MGCVAYFGEGWFLTMGEYKANIDAAAARRSGPAAWWSRTLRKEPTIFRAEPSCRPCSVEELDVKANFQIPALPESPAAREIASHAGGLSRVVQRRTARAPRGLDLRSHKHRIRHSSQPSKSCAKTFVRFTVKYCKTPCVESTKRSRHSFCGANETSNQVLLVFVLRVATIRSPIRSRDSASAANCRSRRSAMSKSNCTES